MRPDWIVMKFGGTSVAGRRQWETIASLARNRLAEGHRVLLVCSAVAGVTNRLSVLADVPDSDEAARELIETHRQLGSELGVDEGGWLPEASSLLRECIDAAKGIAGPPGRARLLASGEWMSTRIGADFLRRQGLDAVWVDAREGLEVVAENDLSPARQWLSADCAAGADAQLATSWSRRGRLLVTQGFIARAPDGRTALLGRGGSDTSAALLAGRLGARSVEIWTDVPGLFSADPHQIPGARLLSEVDYDEALEMAASGARVVHPRCIRAAAKTGTPLRVRDVNRPEVAGTRIDTGVEAAQGVKAVTCQREMAVMLLQNLDARRQVGFLARVFDVFRRHGVSIDLVATSETTTTVAVNKAANHLEAPQLDKLAQDLGAHCSVDRFDDCVCVNLVGRGVSTSLSSLHGVMRHFEHSPLLMLSQSANDLCLSLLVPAGGHHALLDAAHSALIPGRAEGVFGPSWEEIEADRIAVAGAPQ